jgi:cell division protein FtsL
MVRANEIRKPGKRGLGWAVLILVLVSELMIHVWIRTESIQARVRISQTQALIQKTLGYRKALGLERDHLNSDARITRIARTRLGLSPDIFNQTIYLSGDKL